MKPTICLAEWTPIDTFNSFEYITVWIKLISQPAGDYRVSMLLAVTAG